MKIYKLIITALLLSALFVCAQAGEKKDIVEAVKVNKIAELLDLDEGMISQLIKLESNLRKLQKDYQKNEDELVGKLEKAIEKKDYAKADEIVNELEKLEKNRVDDGLKLRREYSKKLPKEKRAKYIMLDIKFKAALKDKIIEKIK